MEDVVKNLNAVYSNYPEAIVRGKRAAAVMRSQWTWTKRMQEFFSTLVADKLLPPL